MSQFSTLVKNARADAITAYAGIGAKLSIWTAGYGTKLVEWTWTGDIWGAAAAGVLTMNAPAVNPMTPVADGTGVIARITKADGTTVVRDGFTVGTSGTEVIVSNEVIATTSPVTLNSLTATEA